MFADRLEFPIDGGTVVEAVGDETIESPDKQPQSVADVLGTVPEQQFGSVDELYTTFLGCLDDRYVGRKYYDDRGTDTDAAVDPRRTPENRSF